MAVDKDGNEIKEPTAEEKAVLETKAAEEKVVKDKADEEAKRLAGPAPAIDADAVSKQIADRVAAALVEQPGVGEQPAAPKPTEMNPLYQAIDQHVQPQITESNTNSMDAKDAAIFYSSTPDAREYTDEIEKGCNNMRKQGTPMTRKSIWAWFRGEHEDEFFEKRMKAKEAETEAAKHAEPIGGGGRPAVDTSQDIDLAVPDNTPDQKLDKTLDNVQF